jgi:hypothetical protein
MVLVGALQKREIEAMVRAWVAVIGPMRTFWGRKLLAEQGKGKLRISGPPFGGGGGRHDCGLHGV